MEELTWWRMDEMSGKFSLVYNNVADNSIKCGFKDDDDSSSVFVDSLFFSFPATLRVRFFSAMHGIKQMNKL